MRTPYDVMLTLNRALTREQFKNEYRRIRWLASKFKESSK